MMASHIISATPMHLRAWMGKARRQPSQVASRGLRCVASPAWCMDRDKYRYESRFRCSTTQALSVAACHHGTTL
jgi:hypothetical protein